MVSTRPTPVARRMSMLGVAAVLAATGLAGCGSSSSSASGAASAGSIVVTDARVNEPTVPAKTGAFATISNRGTKAISLTAVAVPAEVAKAAQVHETTMVGGEMQMTQVAEVPIPAGGQLVLKPGGYHVMLMDPTVTVGQTVALSFRFSDGTTVTADAPVQVADAMASTGATPTR